MSPKVMLRSACLNEYGINQARSLAERTEHSANRCTTRPTDPLAPRSRPADDPKRMVRANSRFQIDVTKQRTRPLALPASVCLRQVARRQSHITISLATDSANRLLEAWLQPRVASRTHPADGPCFR
jgi:hypothetical protein